jgi:hypothetical protein
MCWHLAAQRQMMSSWVNGDEGQLWGFEPPDRQTLDTLQSGSFLTEGHELRSAVALLPGIVDGSNAEYHKLSDHRLIRSKDMWVSAMTIRKGPGLGTRMYLLALTVATGLLTSGSSFATDDGKPDQGIEALLRKVEQRVSSKHMVSPDGDSAMDAWQQVLLVIPTTDPKRVRNALRDFAVHWRRRANEEQHDGHIAVAAGLSVFASRAEAMGPGRSHSAPAAGATATDFAPAPLLSSSPPIVPSDAEKAVPPNSELQTPAFAEPPEPILASETAAPVESVRGHHPHTAGPRRRQVDVPAAQMPPVDPIGVVLELLY